MEHTSALTVATSAHHWAKSSASFQQTTAADIIGSVSILVEAKLAKSQWYVAWNSVQTQEYWIDLDRKEQALKIVLEHTFKQGSKPRCRQSFQKGLEKKIEEEVREESCGIIVRIAEALTIRTVIQWLTLVA
jgi:hypothetical protein